ncbi:MAG: hypothetical protein NTW21_23840 [Verrucomicrobia bacterium]|nr:hypothetical protein [Verrucomicrobiota bacterium]
MEYARIWGLVQSRSTISATDKFAYSANAGWIDFRTSAADGVVATESYLAGKAYAANFGWIDLGDGSPANGHTYSNTSASDFGVNLAASGALTGYAYAANVGWLNFEQSYGQSRLDFLTGKFTGYAYAANLGWIALDTPSSDLVTTSLATPDTDGDGIGDAYEMRYCGTLRVMNAISDTDHDGASDRSEYAANTQPKNPADRLRIVSQSHTAAFTQVALTFTSKPNRLYTIERDTDGVGAWAASGLGLFAPDSGATTLRTFGYPAGPRRFFRVVAHLPLSP